MKRRGKLTLINDTSYDWIKTYQKKYSMLEWHFPDIIPSFSKRVVWVEWDPNQAGNKRLDASVHYMLFGSRDRLFHIQACRSEACHLQVFLANLSTRQYPLGSTIELGAAAASHVYFHLSGKADEFDHRMDHRIDMSSAQATTMERV